MASSSEKEDIFVQKARELGGTPSALRRLVSKKRKIEELFGPEKQQELKDFVYMLSNMKATDLTKMEKELITSQRAEPLPVLFKKLLDNHISSVPVLAQAGRYYGMVDILDVIKFAVDKFGKETLVKSKNLDALHDFQEATANDIMQYPYSKKVKVHPIDRSTSLFTALELLSKPGVHRLPILDESKVIGVITQSAIISWLAKNMNKLGPLKEMKVSQMQAAHQYVLSVLEDDWALDAFHLLKVGGVSAVAVINEDGQLIGNVSAKDIKRISSSGRLYERLFGPVREFVENDPIFVTLDDTLEKVITDIHKNGIHRIYVVDESLAPLGVISLSDILGEILPLSSDLTSE